jgi:6-pyruvoyltetrahydropterin/6-carboxytetrahydropterin synthase
MEPVRRVTVERNRLRFAAAHMATIGGELEPLHGHNYDMIVEIEGSLTEDSWVWDFGSLKRMAREIAERLDHKFLLQRDSRLLAIEERDGCWHVGFGSRHYAFPAGDVLALPIDNTTAERISEWVGGLLQEGLRDAGAANVARLTVGIEEMPGQTGWYTVEMRRP